MFRRKKKKITDEEVGIALRNMAEKIRSDMDFDFRVAYGQMGLAENDLVETLTDEQLVLYKIFKEKREEFNKIAAALYQRIY